MKVLYITASLSKGGASVGSRNTIEALRSVGIDVVAVDTHNSKMPYFICNILRKAERLLERVLVKPSMNDAHFLKIFPASLDIEYLIKKHQPDIIQLGFIAGNIINYKKLNSIKKPIVWRLSDFWAVCGPFHYPYADKKSYKNLIINYLYKNYDFSFIKNTTVVAPSIWTKNLIIQKSVIHPKNLIFIPNAVKVSTPSPKKTNVKGRNLVFIIIASNLSDKRKGVLKFLDFISTLVSNYKIPITLKLIGNSSQLLKSPIIDIVSLGSLQKKTVMDHITNSDYLICPSTLDNSPNVVTESLSLGVPVIVQKNSGAESYITPQRSGASFDFSDLSKENLENFHQFISNSDFDPKEVQSICKENFSFNKVGMQYLTLYNKVIK
ncbi:MULTISPECIES: glycosyltransferase [unclassified Providencia]|uniref:glycosyltransferase n=1 Tax=unclassified Providencia TaxID=2633465 RepID=UPI002348FA67|nr:MULTISPECIES: glycosyltransferase [unclassified Providencia]